MHRRYFAFSMNEWHPKRNESDEDTAGEQPENTESDVRDNNSDADTRERLSDMDIMKAIEEAFIHIQTREQG